MAAIMWSVCALSFLGGLAAIGQMPGLALLGFAASFIACPYIWDNDLGNTWLKGKERLLACVAFGLAVPIALLH
jgi:hypothetical protein